VFGPDEISIPRHKEFVMLDRLTRALEDYRKYRHPSLPDFEVGGPYALLPEEGAAVATTRWNDEWPNSKRAGVYLIFGRAGNLLYVGKAWVIGNRLSSYFRSDFSDGEKRTCRAVHGVGNGGWSEHPMYVVTVAVPAGSIFEAAALEEYLIGRLDPSDNKLGRLRDVA
jgi:hypothetical protein